MKSLLRNFLINLAALVVAAAIIPGLRIEGGFPTLAAGAFVLMLINWFIVPLLKVTFLPLNLLTLGLFTWVINVLALYLLTRIIPQIKIVPYFFPGGNFNGFTVPSTSLSILMVAILASFLVGFISHFLHWLSK